MKIDASTQGGRKKTYFQKYEEVRTTREPKLHTDEGNIRGAWPASSYTVELATLARPSKNPRVRSIVSHLHWPDVSRIV